MVVIVRGWTAAEAGRRRHPDAEIGLGFINPGIGQTRDESELPRIACRSAAGENRGSIV
jgi:hypothetical protein